MTSIDKTLLLSAVLSHQSFQRARIQAGNRLYASFAKKLGIQPGETADDSENPQAAEVIKQLRAEYKKLTVGIAKKPTARTKYADSNILTSAAEIQMVRAFEAAHETEAAHVTMVEYELRQYPIYTEYLQGIKGIGPLLAGYLVSMIDITKPRHVSSLYAYAGLDVVMWFELKKRHHPDAPARLRKRHPDGYRTSGPPRATEHDWFQLFTEEGVLLGEYGLPNFEAAKQDGFGEGRSRRRNHLVDKEYLSRKTGELTKTVGISFNDSLKKACYLIATSLMRSGNEQYKAVYQSRRDYTATAPTWADKTKLHRHNDALRMVSKQFLSDLWYTWRTMEGLPTTPAYEDAKEQQELSRAA